MKSPVFKFIIISKMKKKSWRVSISYHVSGSEVLKAIR